MNGDGTPVSGDVKIKVNGVEVNSSVYTEPTRGIEAGSTANCTYTTDASDWTKSTLKFTGEGPVSVEIWEGSGEHYTLNLEIVTGNNYVEGATLNGNANIVLLGNVKVNASSGTNPALTLSGKHLYGNGFEIDCTGSNISSKAFGIISLTNSTMDNVIVKGPTYTSYTGKYGDDYYAASVVCYDNSEITNCHISGAAAPVCVYGTKVSVSDTILSGGVLANMQIRNRGGVTVTNLTTINTQNSMGIVFYGATPDSYIEINGTLTQHNFIAENTSMSNTYATQLKSKMFGSAYSQYHFTSGGTKYANTGIVSMDDGIGQDQIRDNRADKQNYVGMTASFTVLGITVNGYVYSMGNGDPSLLETSYTEPDYTPSTQDPYAPVFTWSVPSADNVAAGGDSHCYKDNSGVLQIQFLQGSSKSINAGNYATFKKYGGSITPASITCTKNSSGASVPVTNGSITFTEAGEYTIRYTYTGVTVYDKNLGTTTSVDYTKTIPVNVRAKTLSPNAVITSSSDTGTIVWGGAGSTYDPDYNPCIPFLDGLTITDYDANGNPYTVLDGSNQASFISSISSASVSGTTVTINLANGTKLVVTGPTVDGSVQLKAYNNKLYYCDSKADNNPGAFTKTFAANSYTYTGENGVAVSYGRARSFTSTTSTDTIAKYSQMTTPWTSNKFLMFDAQGGTVSPTYTGTSPATLPTPTREGYTFLNWNTKADGTGTARNAGTSMSFSSSTTLYAIWAKNVTVTFDGNGGNDPAAIYGGAGTSSTLPTVTLDGFWLEGWYTEANGGTRIGNAGASFTIPAEDTTYYAHWTDIIHVEFDGNGGTAGTSSATFDPSVQTPITLPTATRTGHRFNGWYTAASGGAKVGDAGESFVPTAPTTLYARWTAYTVTYDANGGSVSPASASAGANGSVALPTPTRTGYTFNGWYTAASGGTKIGNGGTSYTPTADITLHAQWTINSYKVTITTSNSSTAVTVNGTTVNSGDSVTYDSVVKVVLSYSQSDSLTFTIKQGNTNVTRYSDEACTSPTTSTAAGTYYFKMPAGDVTINSSSSCIAAGTLITLADGTQKPVEELTGDELLLVWNLETGSFDSAPIVFVDSDPETIYEVITLTFSDGTSVDVIGEHGFFDVDLGEYVYLDANAEEYLGHRFAKSGEAGDTVTLTSVDIHDETTSAWSPVTYGHLCYYVNGMLSMPGGISGLFNIFEVDVETMRYDPEKMAEDIETYGLLSYTDFEGVVSEEAFEAFNGKYLGIAIAKGLLTWDDIERLAERYMPLIG